MRMAISGVEAFELDQLIDLDLEVMHHDSKQPVNSLTTVADSLPGLGIVAAVLGVGNWELSTDRANSTRRLMQQEGLGSQQVAQVRGFADQLLRKPKDAFDPSNRRISLIVQYRDDKDPQEGTTAQAVEKLGASQERK